MGRYAWKPPGEGAPAGPPITFDLCQRCAADPEMIRAALTKNVGPEAGTGEGERSLVRVPHPPYDFSAKPLACTACGRILSVEDD